MAGPVEMISVAIVVALIVLAFIADLLFRAINRGGTGTPQNAAVPPLRLNFVPSNNLRWADRRALFRDTETLLEAGFEEVGDFRGREAPVALRAFVHPDLCIWAAIQCLNGKQQWTDLCTWYDDRTTCAFANLADHGMDRPPWRSAEFHPKLSLPELLVAFVKHRPTDRPMIRVAAADMPRIVSDAYAREMDWRIERGGITADEIERISARQGKSVAPDVIDTIQQAWRRKISDFLDRQCLNQFLKDTDRTADDIEEIHERLFVVHDRTTAEDLESLLSLCDADNELATELPDWEDRLNEAAPRAVFAELNLSLPAHRRARKLSRIEIPPVTADLYLRPEWDAGADEDE